MPARTHNGHALTAEQNEAVDAALELPPVLRIEAFAGSGKTSTLAAIATALAFEAPDTGSGLYLAFNRAIADDAQGVFPPTVEARTIHSLAYGAMIRTIPEMKTRLNTRLTGKNVALLLRTGAWGPFGAPGVGALVLDTLERFCNSSDAEIGPQHVPGRVADRIRVEARTNHPIEMEMLRQLAARGVTVGDAGLVGPATDADRGWYRENRETIDEIRNPAAAIRAARKHLAGLAAELWDRMQTHPGTPLTHSAYLKAWALTHPQLPADYVLADEAQDLNGVMLELLAEQEVPVFFVGDAYQEIYGWRGAINALELVGGRSCRITQSFRFGQPIADLATWILRRDLGADVAIRGFDPIRSRVVTDGSGGPADAVLGRSNAAVLNELLLLAEAGHRVFLVGGSRSFLWLVESLDALLRGRPATHPDLADFNHWTELKEYVETESGRDLAAVVKAVETHGADRLLRALATCPEREADADVVLSTAHRAKGRQWPRVRLLGDFRLRPEDGEERETGTPWSPEESRITYVAATRGQLEIDVTACRDLARAA